MKSFEADQSAHRELKVEVELPPFDMRSPEDSSSDSREKRIKADLQKHKKQF